MINTSSYVFHVVGGRIIDREKDRVATTTIHGSCFYLGGNFFLTAKHVIENARSSERQAIGFLKEGKYHYREFDKIETFENIDLGIIQVDCNGFELARFAWLLAPRHMLDSVYTFGFPFGLIKEEEKELIATRAFMGYIISSGTPRSFCELSFNCPRGLSGAPLLDRSNDKVVGVIIGNSVSKINVYKVEKKVEGKDEVRIYEQDETVYFGQAMQADLILDREPRLLGMSIKRFLETS